MKSILKGVAYGLFDIVMLTPIIAPIVIVIWLAAKLIPHAAPTVYVLV